MSTQKTLRYSSWQVTSLALLLSLFLMPLSSIGAPLKDPYEQNFIITAYYSPEPSQCCYVMGDLLADRFLNGDGVHGADGTAVYPGMIAAPSTYAFGTRITLPGLGTVTVHDRGGAITELDSGEHRLDLWVGSGEEGLARALAFGVQHVRGTVYPVGSHQPTESIVLESLPAPASALVPYIADELEFLRLLPRKGDHGVAVLMLQQRLQLLGLYDGLPSTVFDHETEQALTAFNAAHTIADPGDRLTQKSAALMLAAIDRSGAPVALTGEIDPRVSGEAVLSAKRALRFLGFYRGRTTGTFDAALESAVTAFQIAEKIIPDELSSGAGRIGPKTREAINRAVNEKHVVAKAASLLTLARVDLMLAGNSNLKNPIKVGQKGKDVAELQRFLVRAGFLDHESISGKFGTKTREAVIAYQLARVIIKNTNDQYAGFVGPLTLQRLKKELRQQALQLVKEKGWQVL